MPNPKEKNDTLFWTALAVAVLLVILFFGLRPKGLRLENPVDLDPEKGAIIFRRNGIAFVDDLLSGRIPYGSNELTIEMAVRAGSATGRGFGSLLMLHDGSDQRQLFVGQWGSSMVIMNGNDYNHTRKLPRLSVKNVFSTEKIRWVTICANGKGTRLYVDGSLVGSEQKWQLEVPKQGKKLRLVVGNSVTGGQSWTGEIYGLGLYGKSLSPEKVKHHYDGWIRTARFPIDPTADPLVLYTFAERQGRLVPDQSGRNQTLQIPSQPIVLEKAFLSPPWRDFKLDRSFFVDATLNLIGFIPLGAVLFGWLKALRLQSGKFVVPAIIAFCFLLSLGMEIIQAWMPTRSSSLLDLTLNTLGAWLGICLFESAMRIGWICSYLRRTF